MSKRLKGWVIDISERNGATYQMRSAFFCDQRKNADAVERALIEANANDCDVVVRVMPAEIEQ